MKIGIVLSKSPSYSETFFISKIEGLVKAGHHITLFVQKSHSDFNLCPVKLAPRITKKNKILQIGRMMIVWTILLVRFPGRARQFIKLERKAERSIYQAFKNMYSNAHLLKANLDWVHFGFVTMGLQSEHVPQAIKAKAAVSLRGFDVDIYPLDKPNCYNLLWQHIDKVHAISHYTLRRGYELGMPKSMPFNIITPAIDTRNFQIEKSSAKNRNRFLTVGRLHWIKGYSYVLEAMSMLKDKGYPFKYRIVGDGPDFPVIKYLIHQLNLADCVEMIGRVSHKKIKDYYSNADYYIQYSLSEGFCNTVLEAQAMGVYCIVSDGGGLPENVIDKTTGTVVVKRNPEALVNSLEEVLNLPQVKYDKIRQDAIERTHSHFDLETYNKKFDAFYSS